MKPRARIKSIAWHLPGEVLGNDHLAREFPDWSVGKIFEKTGIAERRIAAPGECASDLAVVAAEKLFAADVRKSEIDYLILCTQSPDYFLPTTACVLQERLGLPVACGAIDVNQGCSGYIYGLGLAKGLIESGQARQVLLLTAETYTKFIHPADKSVRTLFGDGAAATLVAAEEGSQDFLWAFAYGTDGRGAKNLMVPAGGLRQPVGDPERIETTDASGNIRAACNLYMNGPEIFAFSMREVPRLVEQVLERGGLAKSDVDIFAFHQANKLMLDSLRRKLDIPAERFLHAYETCGNTVSSTIPIALAQARDSGGLRREQLVLAVGFGVGYSWAGCLIRW